MYQQLFLVFSKIGTFTIGGGYAMIALIENEVVDRKKWLTNNEFTELLALSQSAPGPLAVNVAVLTGYKLKGWRGGLVASLGAIIPSFVIILVVVMFFSNTIKNNPTVELIFKGIRPVVPALIAVPAYKLFKSGGFAIKTIVITVVSVLLICLLNISPVYIILAAALFGLFSGIYSQKK